MKKHFSIYLSVSKVIHLLIINCSGDCSFSSLKQLFSSIKLMFFIIKNTKIRSPPILTTEKAYFLSKIMQTERQIENRIIRCIFQIKLMCFLIQKLFSVSLCANKHLHIMRWKGSAIAVEIAFFCCMHKKCNHFCGRKSFIFVEKIGVLHLSLCM